MPNTSSGLPMERANRKHRSNSKSKPKSKPLGYDLRFDYDITDNRDVDYEYHDDLKKTRNRDRNYTWTSVDSNLAQILLFLKLIKWKKLRSRKSLPSQSSSATTISSSSSSSSSSSHNVRISTNSRIKSKSTTTKSSTSKNNLKLKRLKEQQYIERLDKDSIEYKVLTSDKSKLRKISKLKLSKHIIPSSTQINKDVLENNNGIWMLIHGFIFDISSILECHPGGVECLLDCVGVDATRVFDDVGHSDIAWEMLENSIVGVIEDSEALDEDNSDKNEQDDNNDSYEAEIDEFGNLNHNDNVNTNNRKNNMKLIWDRKALDFVIFFLISLFSLVCYIFLQFRKLEGLGS